MNKLFNRTFFRFTIGFIGILLVSFLFAIVVDDFDSKKSLPANSGVTE